MPNFRRHYILTNYRLETRLYVKLIDWISLSRLIWIYAVSKNLLFSPVTVKEFKVHHSMLWVISWFSEIKLFSFLKIKWETLEWAVNMVIIILFYLFIIFFYYYYFLYIYMCAFSYFLMLATYHSFSDKTKTSDGALLAVKPKPEVHVWQYADYFNFERKE